MYYFFHMYNVKERRKKKRKRKVIYQIQIKLFVKVVSKLATIRL